MRIGIITIMAILAISFIVQADDRATISTTTVTISIGEADEVVTARTYVAADNMKAALEVIEVAYETGKPHLRSSLRPILAELQKMQPDNSIPGSYSRGSKEDMSADDF